MGQQGAGADPHMGGAHGGGGHMAGGPQRGLGGGGGARMHRIIAEGQPMMAPQMLVHAPIMPPHKPGESRDGPQSGGGHDGGAQGGGPHAPE